MTTLTDFLIEIGEDPAKQFDYLDDPGAYIQASDISNEHKQLLLNGTDQEVMDEVAREAGTSTTSGPNIKITTLGAGNIKRTIELD